MGARGRSARARGVGGSARAVRYRRVGGRPRLTAAPSDLGTETGCAPIAALVPSLWDQAAAPRGLRAWQRHESCDALVALRRLCRFEVDELERGVEVYLAHWARNETSEQSRMFRETPTPLGWLVFMERVDFTDDPFPRSQLER